ncbi:MAG: hypothetical protein OEZ32_06660 [Nitrospinota bacterium]|nr:hypothetical protein [Nitrospinota bacterium]
MNLKKLKGASLVFFLLASSCSTFSFDRMELGADPMVDHVAQWTRSARLYRQFDTTIIVDVTYYSGWLREKTVEWRAESQRLGPEEKARLQLEQREENDKYAQFYVAIYTTESQWSQLSKSDPAWTVFVQAPEGPVFSEPVVKVRQQTMPWGNSFPYDPRFRSFFKINVPRSKIAPGEIKLVLSSLLGEVAVSWDKQ